ncbi:MAG TPA: hypothetical protein VFC39_05225, partial [Acidobacteriaceae bacterium]|nr:hypothetical protein [Acidobacteriaceae bacterium]
KAQDAQPLTQGIEVALGVPLHIRISRTAPVRLGARVSGVLTESVYVHDRLVLEKGAAVSGVVTEYVPVDRQFRIQALLNGDVTPLHNPMIDFDQVHVAQTGVDVTLVSRAIIRDTNIVRFVAMPKRPSLMQQAKTMVKQRIKEARDTAFGPNKKDRALRLLYSQLPYHPQRIWAGTQFVADLTVPVTIILPTQPPAERAVAPSFDGRIVSARLASLIDSKAAHKGDTVTAIVTEPLFDADHKLVLAEGAELEGTVLESKSARSLGRNGQLRFAFRSVKSESQQQATAVYGIVTGAEGPQSANVTVDSEGNVKANPDKNRFIAPLLLAATAMAGHDDDHHHGTGDGSNVGGSTVASNGFGVIARVIALTSSNANVASGFGAYAFAKSVYFRFLTHGHDVSFPKDTEVEVQLSEREGAIDHSP